MMSESSRILVPPIKCQGIKTKLVPWIKATANWNDTGLWVEPFLGSGVVGFNVAPKRAVFSDLNPHLIRFYVDIQSRQISSASARKYLEDEGRKLSKVGEDHFYSVRDRFNKEGNPLDFLFLNRSCFNGVIRFNRKGEFNTPFCRKPERFSPSYITKIVNQIAWLEEAMRRCDWEFVNLPFDAVLGGLSKKDFVYADPPYLGRHTDYFTSWDEKDEARLASILSTCEPRFILSTWFENSYRRNDSIEKYWSRFYLLTRKHFYHIGGHEENRNEIVEALVVGFKPPEFKEKSLRGSQLTMFEPRMKFAIAE